jgi:alanine dehydrogenase
MPDEMKMPQPVLLLDRTGVARWLTLEDCIRVVEKAFAAQASGRVLASQLLHVDSDSGEFHVKAGGLRGERTYFACKINGGFFQNRAQHDLPNIIGLILLSDGTNGRPLAVMESGLITRLRTGAATAVAARYLASPRSHTATICGAGIQGEIQLRSLLQVLPLQRAYLWSRSGAESTAQRLSQELGIRVQATTDLMNASRQSQVIVTCTPAKSWFLGREHVAPGTFVAAVGADSPDKQEIEPQLLAAASVVPDLLDQAAHVGDLHHAIAAGLMNAKGIRGELGAVIAGQAPRRQREGEIIIFDSTGTALQDAAAAALVYERAASSGQAPSFAFWS